MGDELHTFGECVCGCSAKASFHEFIRDHLVQHVVVVLVDDSLLEVLASVKWLPKSLARRVWLQFIDLLAKIGKEPGF